MTLLEWLGLFVFVPIVFYVWPKRYRQWNMWYDQYFLQTKSKYAPGWVTIWLWKWYDIFAFVCLGLYGVGNWFFWKDPYFSAVPNPGEPNFDWVLGLFGATLIIYKISVLNFMYWGTTKAWRLFAFSLILVLGLVPAVAGLVFICIFVANGNFVFVATSVLALMGYIAFVLLLIITIIIWFVFLFDRTSKWIVVTEKMNKITRRLVTTQEELLVSHYLETKDRDGKVTTQTETIRKSKR